MSPPNSKASRSRGFVAAAGAAMVLSTTAIFIRYLTATHRLPAGVLCFWRSALLVIVLAPVLAILRLSVLVPRRRDLALLCGQGGLLAVFNLTWTNSVARCGASLSTVLVYTSGPFTAWFGSWLLRERVGRSGLASVLLCLVGCALTSGMFGRAPSGDALGVALGLSSGALYALYTVAVRIGAQRGIDDLAQVLHAFAINSAVQLACLAVGPQLLCGAPGVRDLLPYLGKSLVGWSAMVGLAVGPTLFGFALYGRSLRDLRSWEANLLLTLEPPMTLFTAYWLLGERMAPWELLGSALILGGVVTLHAAHRF